MLQSFLSELFQQNLGKALAMFSITHQLEFLLSLLIFCRIKITTTKGNNCLVFWWLWEYNASCLYLPHVKERYLFLSYSRWRGVQSLFFSQVRAGYFAYSSKFTLALCSFNISQQWLEIVIIPAIIRNSYLSDLLPQLKYPYIKQNM